MKEEQNIIIYKTQDGKTSVSLYAKDGSVWMNQQQLAELFDTSVPNISMHISNILKDRELNENSVIKEYLTTAADGKDYRVTFYSLDMILAIGFRVRSKRGTQFRQWANRHLKEYAGEPIPDHFVGLNKMVTLGSSAQRKVEDIALTRYTCYLVVQKGDPAKPAIAFAQTYFAVSRTVTSRNVIF